MPVDAVVVDGVGGYYVWKVVTDDKSITKVMRVDIKVAEMTGDEILIVEGVQRGDRIATAGVHLLSEGQQVRLHSKKSGGKGS